MRLLITGYYGAGNFGDDIMLEALCKKILLEQPNVKITVFKLFEKNLDIDLPKDVKIIEFFKVKGIFRKLYFKFILRKNDMFIWGGGTCFTDEDGDGLYDYMKIAKEQGKKIGYVGVGVGNLQKQERIEKTKYLMNNLDFISVRDEKSYKYCLENVPNPKRKVFLAEDLAYLYFENRNLDKPKKDSDENNTILVSWRNLINYKTEEEETILLEKLIEFLKYLLESDKKNNIRIVPLDDRKDIPRCEYIFKKLNSLDKNRVVLVTNLNPEEKVKELIKCDINISARLHGIFVSEIVGTKTIGLSYSIKIQEFLKSINKEEDYILIDDIEMDNLLVKYHQQNISVDKLLIKEKIKMSNINVEALNEYILSCNN